VLVWPSSLTFGQQVPDEASTTELLMKVRSLCRPMEAGSLAALSPAVRPLAGDSVVIVAGGRPK
jgi:hypothetical protein